MNKAFSTYFLLGILFFSFSCRGQISPDASKEKGDKQKQSKGSEPDVDPYFVESNTITSTYGPSSITRNLIQDRKGFIWLATWEGAIRFDPSAEKEGKASFINFTNKEELRPYHNFSVLEDSKGNIWLGTIGAGVYRYDGKSFTNFTTKDGLAHDNIGCIYEDEKGNIWFGTLNGISIYNPYEKDKSKPAFSNLRTSEDQYDNDINTIIQDQNGTFWIGTRGKAFTYSPSAEQEGRAEFTSFTNKDGAPFINVRKIIEDKNSHIWLGGNNGLWRYAQSVKQEGRNTFTHYTKNFVGYIYEDEKGNIWTSSASAYDPRIWELSRYDKASLLKGKNSPATIKKEKGMFFGILEDMEGNIWVGKLDGVYQYDGLVFNPFYKNLKYKGN